MQICTNVRRQVCFVDHEQIGLDHALTRLARNLFTLGHVDNVDGEIHQLWAERGRQVVATGLDEDDLQIGMAFKQLLDGSLIHGGVLADCGVRTAAGLDADDSVNWEHTVPGQNLRVLCCVDVVGDRGHRDLF